ncbi:Thioredoxin-like protein 1 [Clonorchis sinensis]|nr:Thioredoxin-like protein 1 [Clonorchis sinensis]
MVVNIDDKEQLIRFLTEASNRPGGPGLVVLDFFATWCRPCSEIAPVFSSLSETHTEARFLKVDVDKNDSVASEYGIRSLPTFVFLRGNKEVDRLTGARPDQLEAKLREHLKEDSAETISQSSGRGSVSQPDLSPFLDTTQCECLNEDDTHPLSNLLSSEMGDGYLLSDTDAQLIIFITFAQFVRLRSLQINGPEDCGPKTVKLFVNQTSTPDFSACESADAVQTLELETKDLIEGAIVPLNFVKFQNVTTITVFVADNQTGKEVTRIDRLRFFGTCVNTTNMQNFKRVAGKAGEGHS